MNTRSQKFLHIVPLLCVLALFLGLCLFRLTSCEPEWDEAINIDFAVTLLHGENPFSTNSLVFFPSVHLPPMTCFYTGSFVLYLKIPAMLLFGTSLFWIRASFVVLAVIGLAGLFYTVRHLLSPSAALLCTLLTASNTLFIRASRMSSENEEIATLSLFWIGAALLCAFAKHKKTIYTGLSGFIWGIAVFTKLLAGIYLTGLLVAFIVFRKRIMKTLGPDKKHAAVFTLMFIVGVFPLINYAITTGDFSSELKTFAGSCVFPKDTNAPLAEKIRMRMSHLEDFLCQTNIVDHVNPEEGFPPALPLVTFLLCLLCLGSKRLCKPETKTAIGVVFIMSATVFTALLFTPQDNAPPHMLALIPFIEILTAIVFYAALTVKPVQLKILILTLLIGCGLYTLANEARMLRNYLVMSKRRGTYTKSEQSAVNYIRQNNLYPVYAAHMRKGRTLIKYLYPGLPEKLRKPSSGKADIYILYGQTNADNIIDWEKIAQQYGLQMEKLEGPEEPEYRVYKVSLKNNEDMTNLLNACGGLNRLYIDNA